MLKLLWPRPALECFYQKYQWECEVGSCSDQFPSFMQGWHLKGSKDAFHCGRCSHFASHGAKHDKWLKPLRKIYKYAVPGDWRSVFVVRGIMLYWGHSLNWGLNYNGFSVGCSINTKWNILVQNAISVYIPKNTLFFILTGFIFKHKIMPQ